MVLMVLKAKEGFVVGLTEWKEYNGLEDITRERRKAETMLPLVLFNGPRL